LDRVKPNQIGLRYRMKRAAHQIHGQHELLRPIFTELAEAISGGSTRDAQTAAFRLEGAVRAHFLLEEEVVFPALHGLCPQREDDLKALTQEHSRFLEDLESLVGLILDSELNQAAGCLTACIEFIREHEQREEAVVRDLVESSAD
jgi:hypothetical protein